MRVVKKLDTKNKMEKKMSKGSKRFPRMDCGPKYSKVSESLRYVTSGSIQCSMFCGGKQCKYEGQAKWSDREMVIKGLYSSWATDNILAMARPSTKTIKKFNIIEQFQRWGITAVINLQHPGEHANCGFGLEKSGFTYNPEVFMDNGIFFYNFIWQDYGVRSLESVLDIIKVTDFALQNGKVAVHCHAGLGRTGVLIACYLIYSLRVTPEQAIHTVRIKRPRSVQTRGQISCVQNFAKFLKPLWVIFPSCSYAFGVKPFTLEKYLVHQKHVLHGYEARELKFIPKIVYVSCKRLLELCDLDASKLRLTNHRFLGKADDDTDTTDFEEELESSVDGRNDEALWDISASLEDLKGEFDTETVPVNEADKLSSSQQTLSLEDKTRRKSDSVILCTRHKINTYYDKDGIPNKDYPDSGRFESFKQSSGDDDNILIDSCENGERKMCCTGMLSEVNEHSGVSSVASAFFKNIKSNSDVMDKVLRLQRLLNESDEGWKALKAETNPCVLTTLVISWLDSLVEPVLSVHDVQTLVENIENPREALLNLSKSQRGICECLLATVFKLNFVENEDGEKALRKILAILTRIDREATSEDENCSFLMTEFFKFCMLLYESWLKEVT